jgi:hypothetical protein
MIKKLSLALIGLVLAFLFLEVALRILSYSFPPFVKMDPTVGWSLAPNVQGWTRNEGGKIYLRINSDGLRDFEHVTEKPANTLRVAILGDSYAEAAQVRMEESFWSVLELRLAACPSLAGKKVEVINFGVDGYGTDQELLTLREKVWKYAPDVVVLLFTPSNDVTDNSRVLAVDKEKPFFVEQGDKLILNTSFRDTVQYRVRQTWPIHMYYRMVIYSRVLQLLKQAATLWRQHKLVETVQGTSALGGGKLGLADMSYQRPVEQAWTNAWQVTESILSLMNDDIRAKGAVFLVSTNTRAIQVNPDAEVRRRYMERLGVDDLFYPERRLAALGKTAGFRVLSLAQPFQEYAERNHEFLHFGVGHWNPKGNQLAGELISREICEMHLGAK